MQQMTARIFPTMVTPFTDDDRLDLDAVDALVERFVQKGCDGLFAVCQSSEMFFLSDAEKRTLLRRIIKANNGRLQVVASGHTADDLPGQVRQLSASMEDGAQAAVVILNRLARPDEGEAALIRAMEALLDALPDVPVGLYECPYPYKTPATPGFLRWCAQTGRVGFFKDTCCDIEEIKLRLQAVEGTSLRLFNANTATLLASLRQGARGFSGVMANFHADLYAALLRLHDAADPQADALQDFLTLGALIERQCYPINAKYSLRQRGIPMGLHTRAKDDALWNPTFATEVDALWRTEDTWRSRLGLPAEASLQA